MTNTSWLYDLCCTCLCTGISQVITTYIYVRESNRRQVTFLKLIRHDRAERGSRLTQFYIKIIQYTACPAYITCFEGTCIYIRVTTILIEQRVKDGELLGYFGQLPIEEGKSKKRSSRTKSSLT